MRTGIFFRWSVVTLFVTFLYNYTLAITVTVSTLNFTGTGSLNEAINTINSIAGTHTINFGVTGTITATTLLPTITGNAIVNAYDVTIDGDGSHQIFDIASSSDFVINGITVTNANAVVGSVISNRGNLMLKDVNFNGNRTTDRGGAIYNQGGNIVIHSSAISNNQAGGSNGGGGGIYNSGSGTVEITNSTFTNNFSFTFGGAINNLGVMSITNCTIASNSAFDTGGTAGGGIKNQSQMDLYNSIVYNNTVGFFGTPQDMHNSSFLTQDNNLVGVCAGSCPSFDYNSDPLLAPINNNGGPTPTMELLTGSPAIDPNPSSTTSLIIDQRGYPRDGNPDLGAYEADAIAMQLGSDLELVLRIFLNGAYDASSGLMRDDLRIAGLIPLNDPYGLSTTTTNAVLNVTGNNAIVDWILIELRDNAAPSTAVIQVAALLQRDGDVVSIDGASNILISSMTSGNYTVAIRHRNHLGVMGSTIITIN